MRFLKSFAAVAITVSMFSCGNQLKEVKSLETELDSVSYAVGLSMAGQLRFNFKEVDKAVLVQGIINGLDSTNLLIKEDKINGALDQLFTFYEQILLCREMDLCEEEVAKKFFDIDAQGFVNTYYPYICNLRKEWHNPNQYKKIAQFYSKHLTC